MKAKLDEFRACAELLIDNAVIASAVDRDEHARIRRNLRPLNAWFADRTGWRVQDHPEFVRLVTMPARAETAHAAPWARDRRDLELYAWALWYGEQTKGRKFTVSQMAKEIRDRSVRTGLEEDAFDWRRLADRRRLARIFDALEAQGAIRVRDGSLTEWQDEEGKRDALCEWGALAWQLHITIPSRILERLATGEAVTDLTGLPSPSPRMRAYRQLLLGPALFRREDEEAYLHVTNEPIRTRSVAEDLLEHTGWELEVTSAYVRLLRSPTRMDSVRPPIPADSSLSHLVVLACGGLRRLRDEGALPDAGGGFHLLPEARLDLLVADLREAHGANWKKDFRTASAERLTADLVPEMKRWGLLRGPLEDGTLLVTPLASRLDGRYANPQDSGEDDSE